MILLRKNMNKRTTSVIILLVIVLVVIILFWYILINDSTPNEIQDEMPTGATTFATGIFQSGDHPTSGTAYVLDSNGTLILRFENFKTDSGPGLYVYLSVDLEATEYIDLGALKSTEGDANYDIDSPVDFNNYKYVLIWCEPFSVVFGYAELIIEENA
jgi:hypothetical protein